MRFYVLSLLTCSLLIACGSKSNNRGSAADNNKTFEASPEVEGEASKNGLFGIAADRSQQTNSLLGLWESDELVDEFGTDYRMRVRFSENEMEITKMCMYENDIVGFSSMTYEGSFEEDRFVLFESGLRITSFKVDRKNYSCISGLKDEFTFRERDIEEGRLNPGEPEELRKIGDWDQPPVNNNQ